MQYSLADRSVCFCILQSVLCSALLLRTSREFQGDRPSNGRTKIIVQPREGETLKGNYLLKLCFLLAEESRG